MTSTPGPAVDLIEYAAQIIVAKMREPGTAPYHWAGALWEAGMLVSPGSPTSTGREAEAATLSSGWLERVVTQAAVDLVEIPETSRPAWFRNRSCDDPATPTGPEPAFVYCANGLHSILAGTDCPSCPATPTEPTEETP